MMENPNNLLAVYLLYTEHIKDTQKEKSAKETIAKLQTAVIRFLLPGLGYEYRPKGKKMSLLEVKSAKEFMETQAIKILFNAREVQQKGFDLLQAPDSSRRFYRWVLDVFVTWCETQPWFPKQRRKPDAEEQRCPLTNQGFGSISNTPLTTRKNVYKKYKLDIEETSPTLQKELEQFHSFLTRSNYPGRLIDPIEVSTADRYIFEIRLILGWLHRYKKIPLQELCLDLLIPLIPEANIESLSSEARKKLFKEKKIELETWICEYFSFLEEVMEAKSPRTKNTKINSLLALAKFRYFLEVENETDYTALPLYQVLLKYSRKVSKEKTKWNRNKYSVSNQQFKWPETNKGETALDKIRAQIVEPLRLSCRLRYNGGHRKESIRIVVSHMRYLIWVLLGDMPPRRQQEYRSLKIALSCPIERPTHVPVDGLYHPLPPQEIREKREDGTLQDNYLYKTYFYDGEHYPSGVWVLDIQAYKTLKTYGPQQILIPDRNFEDGNRFYDYLERYLYGWWLPMNLKQHASYDWWQANLKGKRGRWVMKGRAEFSPKDHVIEEQEDYPHWAWGYLLLRPNEGTPYSGGQFSAWVSACAHRAIGKRVTPHTMRYIWATWSYQKRLSDREREALAYAMGHDVKTLRQMYERCTSNEKRQPIEEAINELLFPRNQDEDIEHNESNRHLEKLLEEFQKLPIMDKDRLLQIISSSKN